MRAGRGRVSGKGEERTREEQREGVGGGREGGSAGGRSDRYIVECCGRGRHSHTPAMAAASPILLLLLLAGGKSPPPPPHILLKVTFLHTPECHPLWPKYPT